MNDYLDVSIFEFGEHRYFYVGIGVMEYRGIVPSWMDGRVSVQKIRASEIGSPLVLVCLLAFCGLSHGGRLV